MHQCSSDRVLLECAPMPEIAEYERTLPGTGETLCLRLFKPEVVRRRRGFDLAPCSR